MKKSIAIGLLLFYFLPLFALAETYAIQGKRTDANGKTLYASEFSKEPNGSVKRDSNGQPIIIYTENGIGKVNNDIQYLTEVSLREDNFASSYGLRVDDPQGNMQFTSKIDSSGGFFNSDFRNKARETATIYGTDPNLPNFGKPIVVNEIGYSNSTITSGGKWITARNVEYNRKTSEYDATGQHVISTLDVQRDPTGQKMVSWSKTWWDESVQVTKQEYYQYENGVLKYKYYTEFDKNGEQISRVRYTADANGVLQASSKTTDTNYERLTRNCGIFDANSSCYEPISEIKTPDGAILKGEELSNFRKYAQNIYKIGVGICFVLGVIMFTWAGIEYIFSETPFAKVDAKGRIIAALTGLAIALVSYVLLQTINPDLLLVPSKLSDIAQPK